MALAPIEKMLFHMTHILLIKDWCKKLKLTENSRVELSLKKHKSVRLLIQL